MDKQTLTITQRNSSVEILKILAILLIVISHVIQTLTSTNAFLAYNEYVVDITSATSNISTLIIAMMRYSGCIGNTIFFVCSSWFLIDSSRANYKKVLQMIADIWVISVLILVIVYFVRGSVNGSLVVRSLLPTAFSCNWYMTCYLLFYAVHPLLNIVIRFVSQKSLLCIASTMTFLYIILAFISNPISQLMDYGFSFFGSTLILWISIYFIIAYGKLYLINLIHSVRFNVILFVTGLILTYGLILATNAVGLRVTALSNTLQVWNENNNPFIILMVIGLFNLFIGLNFHSRFINYISKLSIFIYIIHENLLLRTYYRPAVWEYIYQNIGYGHIVAIALLFSLLIFISALVVSIFYKETIHRLLTKICNLIYPRICATCSVITERIMSIH